MDRCVPAVQVILVSTSRGSNNIGSIVHELQVSWEGVRITTPNSLLAFFSDWTWRWLVVSFDFLL